MAHGQPVEPGNVQAKLLRVVLALNALAATVGLAIKFRDAATLADPRFHSVVGRVTNELCYFTILSNMIVVAVCIVLVRQPSSTSRLQWAARLTALVCITITAVVYYALLAGDEHFHGLSKVGDVLAHFVSPVLYVGGWIVLGPRGRVSRRSVGELLVFPLAWIGLTLVRGSIIHFYPYDFLDVDQYGYVSVLLTVAVILAGALALAGGAFAYDRRRTRVRS